MSNNPRIFPINKIKFEGLTYAHEGHDATLLNCDFEFPTGYVTWIKSMEGAGKSTLLQILAGLLIPQSGSYFINDDNVVNMTFEDFLKYRLAIGYTFDYGGLINNMTIQDNLLLPLVYHDLIPREEAKKRVESYIKKFDLEKFRSERPAHVPGRVRKLACLLRSLVIQPQMLLMDDPSVGLGADTTKLFADTIDELRSEGFLKHVFVSSYDEKFMSLLDYNIIQLDQGQIYYQADQTVKKVAHL